MLSIVRTVTIVLAGTVTVTGCGGGGGAGAGVAAGAAPAVIGSVTGFAGEVAAARLDLSAFGAALVFAGRFAGSASGTGVAGCGTEICAVATLIWSFTRLTPFVSDAIL